jgi:DNA polymerase-4
MTTITRSHTLPVPTQSSEEINAEARRLFLKHWKMGEPIRLLGVALQNLSPLREAALQLDLFTYEEQPKKDALIKAMDKLRDKYGEDAVLTAGMLGDDPSALIRNKRIRGTSLQKDDSLLYIDD